MRDIHPHAVASAAAARAAPELHADCDHASAYGPARGAGVYCAAVEVTASKPES